MLGKLPPVHRRTLRELVIGLLRRMVELEASDIDLGGYGCGDLVWFRIFGRKTADRELGTFSPNETDILIQNILSNHDRASLFSARFVDFSFSMIFDSVQVRFRATAYYDLNHLGLNMRLINKEIRPLSSLGFHENVLKTLSLQHIKHGLVLITGITGSGKSTTLDSIIDANNRTCEAHIIIISSPVEFVHEPKKSIVRHREVGRDVHSFKEGTIQSLRQDPDIIVIGEMRDADTIATVLEVADSGHKVFTTLHTSSATEAVDRILGETPSSEQNRIRERLADVLTCVISQKLVPDLMRRLVLAKEVLLATPAIRAAIRNNHTDELYQLIYQGSKYGMITLEQDLVRLYRNKTISLDEAYSQANNKKRFEDLIKLI
ncbi:PilT/PilU family type 4a pilus ATPase [candidate division KSB1 bacterium]|nr:PilT/PilU family type 4a pilus ATPase [candidate division KSB1 bacterium]